MALQDLLGNQEIMDLLNGIFFLKCHVWNYAVFKVMVPFKYLITWHFQEKLAKNKPNYKKLEYD